MEEWLGLFLSGCLRRVTSLCSLTTRFFPLSMSESSCFPTRVCLGANKRVMLRASNCQSQA